jgi:hypothetical protein
VEHFARDSTPPPFQALPRMYCVAPAAGPLSPKGGATLPTAISCKPYGKTVFQALELAETDRAHPLPYVGGLREMENYPPDTFTWFYDGSGKAKEGMGVRDNRTGLVAVWPHLRGSVNTSSDPPGCPAVPQAKCS